MSMSNPEARTGTRSVAVGPDVLPYARMKEISELKAQDYAAAQPFPHIVIDDFFDPAVLERVLAEFPDKRDKNWGERDIPEEVKLFSKGELGIPYYTKQLLYAMNSSGFLQFLEKLTGIPKLIGDPQYEAADFIKSSPEGSWRSTPISISTPTTISIAGLTPLFISTRTGRTNTAATLSCGTRR
jgi:hypothetical protein